MKINKIYLNFQDAEIKKIIILDKIKPKIVIFKLKSGGEKRYSFKLQISKDILKLKRSLNAKRN